MNIENIVRAYITTGGLRQCEIAKRAGISGSTLSEWLNFKGSMTVPTFQAVCNALEIRISVCIEGVELPENRDPSNP